MVDNCFCCNSAICEGPHTSYLLTEDFNEYIVQKSICIRSWFVIFMMAYVSQMAVMLLGIHKKYDRGRMPECLLQISENVPLAKHSFIYPSPGWSYSSRTRHSSGGR